jgi:hypothetical protein
MCGKILDHCLHSAEGGHYLAISWQVNSVEVSIGLNASNAEGGLPAAAGLSNRRNFCFAPYDLVCFVQMMEKFDASVHPGPAWAPVGRAGSAEESAAQRKVECYEPPSYNDIHPCRCLSTC